MRRLSQHIRISGSIAPSSRFLISRLLRSIDFASEASIVELGAGTGCVTRALLQRMSPTSRLIALDIEEEFANACRVISDDRLTVYHACATDLSHLLKQAGVPAVDYIVSSIPLSIVDDNVADEILRVAESSLRPGGRFLQYQYSLGYLSRLTARFSNVRVGFTLRNIPPAVVYECETRRGDSEGVMEAIGSAMHEHSATQ